MRIGPPCAALLVVAATGCKTKRIRPDDAATRPRDATAAAATWPELEKFEAIDPVRVVSLPTRPGVPRFTVGGPVLAGELAIVSSSQFGFVAVDYRRGQVAWTKPAGAHVAPPIVVPGGVALIGDCLTPPDVPADETLLGCVRVVAATGADRAFLAIHGKTSVVAGFASEAGDQRVWHAGDDVVWRRGEHAVAINLLSGVATPAPAQDPPLVVTYKDRSWQIRRDDDGLLVASSQGREAWRTESAYGALLGAVYLPEQSPMVRVSSAIMHGGAPELLLFDIDATGSLHGQVSMSPVPGIGLIGHANSTVGDVALAVRLDRSLQRDYIAGYAANALLMWIYPLPVVQRADPIGIAIAPDAVVVFHDGDTLTILPELSAPPTAPGAVRAPPEITTP